MAISTALMPNKQPLVSGLYGRVSTGRQENEATIESQLAEIKARIEADGNILPTENIFIDDGWTGEILQRPALDAMRDAAVVGNFQILYVYDRGRISRIFTHQEIVLEELRDKEIQFESLHDVKAITAEERVLQAMQGVFHEYERVKIAERMRRGKLYKARSGIMINGGALYGYNYIKKTDISPTHYEINEEEASVVRKIFHWVGVERISLHKVIQRLYDEGIPPRKRRSEFWTKGPVVGLLQCETYINGIAFYNKSEAIVAKNPIKKVKYKKIKRTSRKARPREDWIPLKVPVLLEDKNVFENVQKILAENQIYARKNKKYNYLLSGLIYCQCGCRRAGDGTSKYGHFYYRCSSRINNLPITDRKCTAQGVNAAVLDGLLWSNLKKLITDPETLRANVKEWLEIQVNNQADIREQNRLLGKIAELSEEEKRYAKAYGTGTLDFEQFQELIKDARKRKTVFQKQLGVLDKKKSLEAIDIEEEELYNEAIEVIKKLDFSDKFKTIRDVIDKIILKERS